MMKGNPNALSFEELVSVLLQEDQSRQYRSIMRVADQDFIASQKSKGQEALLLVSKNMQMLRIQRRKMTKMRRRQ